MKIVLTAFGEKLKSEPIDWPEDTPLRIKLFLDMDRQESFCDEVYGKIDYYSVPVSIEPRCGVFERTHRAVCLSNGERAYEYVLVNI